MEQRHIANKATTKNTMESHITPQKKVQKEREREREQKTDATGRKQTRDQI